MDVAISVVIVTRNRAQYLQNCLTSLSCQTIFPQSIIVVDNASTDQTKQVVADFQRQGLNISRVVERRVGYPFVYNLGLKTAKTEWVAFIDDDCVADQHWFAELAMAVKKNPHAGAILGYSLTKNPSSVWSLATWSFDQLWKNDNFVKVGRYHQIMDLTILDNKNIIYNAHLLRQKNIRFNEAVVLAGETGAAEDMDLGWQMQMANLQAWFQPTMKVFHQDPTNPSWYVKKIVASAQAVARYQQRRNQSLPTTKIKKITKRSGLLFQWRQTSALYTLSAQTAFVLACIMIGSVLITRSVMCWTKFLLKFNRL